MSAESTSRTDVLVVGAGPTGLMLAGELARRGVTHRIVDAAPAPTEQSRAIVVHARTLEIFASVGLAEALRARGKVTRSRCSCSTGERRRRPGTTTCATSRRR